MKQQLLLLKDVHGLGRSGDVVTAKPGFIRNFLLPQKRAVIADKNTLKMQTRLKQEREKQAAVDRKGAEELAVQLKDLVLTTEEKSDREGKMYGSVTALDIARMLQEKGHTLDRKNIVLPQPLKTIGVHKVELKLIEGVAGSIMVDIQPEGGPLPVKKPEEAAPAPEASPESPEASPEPSE